MVTLPAATITGWKYRPVGWAAVASGVTGIIVITSLIAYLTTQVDIYLESGVMPLTGTILLTSSFVGALLQALFMIPVAVALDALARHHSPVVSRAAVIMVIIALCVVAPLRVLPLATPAVSDILFIGPMGFVGLWLIVVNWLLKGTLSRGLRVAGIVAGIGFSIAGAGFFLLGGLTNLANPTAYADNLPFHITLWFGAIPGFIIYPIWAILLGRRLLRPVS